jgi:anhydro-N-acetylmuramic acid kinase
MPEYYVGLMSGTSMDGIDAALVDFSGDRPVLVSTHSQSWPNDLLKELHACRELEDAELRHLDKLDNTIGEHFADATNQLLQKAGVSSKDILAIGSHGQTIRHRPDTKQPFSLQLGNAEVIAQQTGIKVVSDFRTADIKAGGQGAPLAPAFHNSVFRSRDENRAVLNIGGIANLTLLPADTDEPVTGFDTGPGNTLMDAWVKETKGESYDADGKFAASGQVNENLLKSFLSDAYFEKTPPKSTGFEDFNLDWLNSHMKDNLPEQDVQATLCELTARSISDAVKRYASSTTRLLVCGGGVHNHYLMTRIKHYLNECDVESTEALGIHPDWVEAMAFAWLARQTIKGLPGNLPSVTGAHKAVVLGNISK